MLFLTLLTVGFINGVFCANILYVTVIASPSHYIWNRALAYGLVEEGHNVTLIGPIKDKSPKQSNYTLLLMEGITEGIAENFDLNEFADNLNAIQLMKEYDKYSLINCQLGLKSKALKHLLDYPKQFTFDLIIFDSTLGSCFYPLIQKFKFPPTISVSPFLLPPYISYNFGNGLFPSYLPWSGLPYTTNMNFWERCWNYLLTYLDVGRHYWLYVKEGQLAKEVFGDDIPSMFELENHISIVLCNIDPILHYPQPLPPNIIAVGGLHTRPPKKLPKELENILNSAKNGVILFSLGTNVRSDKLHKDKRQALLDVFGKLKETVIWKFESDIENLPKNVFVRKWLPQSDILGHPNVKVFIGHGGALSTQEAIYFGVPMIGVPFFLDQHLNVQRVVKNKLGIHMDFHLIAPQYVEEKLREILDNPIYKEKMKKASERFRDRSETPLQRAIFWVEYLMRHKNADFLNTGARHMNFVTSTSLDVIVFFIFLVVVAATLLLKFGQIALRMCLHRKDKLKTN